MSKVPFPFVPTPNLLESPETQLVLARRRVLRGQKWLTSGFRESQGYGEQFLVTHGFLADEHVSEKARRIAWEELAIQLARAVYLKVA
jgi:hypothetical protein